MMTSLRCLSAILSIFALLAAVPRHVQTADYWNGYAGTKVVPAAQAARALSWVETGDEGAAQIKPLGVKTIAYNNPNRVQPRDPIYRDDDAMFAHTCTGGRARGDAAYQNLYLTDPRSPALLGAFRQAINSHGQLHLYSAIFADEAVGSAYALDTPCGFDFDQWLAAENQLFSRLGAPVIYNGLNLFNGHSPSKVMALNASAIGGMMEECYAQLSGEHRVGGWAWWATEDTELRMAAARKYFFCYGRDLTPADQAYDSRMYTYASFLLSYDPRTSVIWEYYKTPTGGHVMPESQLVALDPVVRVTRVAQLRTNTGAFVREYRKCYIAGRFVGGCAAAVNPDSTAHALQLPGYRRTLALNGSGVFDGGTIGIANAAPPSDIQPLGAVIAFR